MATPVLRPHHHPLAVGLLALASPLPAAAALALWHEPALHPHAVAAEHLAQLGQERRLGHDGERRADDFVLVEYAIPAGNLAAYFPETNPLVPLDHHAERARTPASKAIPVRIERRPGQ